jgi:nitronate monooxygenase
MHSLPHLQLPLVAAPMFIISNPSLVIACCKEGVVGTFPALNPRSTEELEEWILTIKKELAAHEASTGQACAPFGINLIVHPSNPRLEPDLRLIMKHKVPLVITSLGAAALVVEAVHSYGGLVYHDVIKKRHAEKAAEAGVDGLILVSAGAGGHAGLLNPMAFVGEVKRFFKKTLLLSGCISSGGDIAAALAMGADLAYAGTAFIPADECGAVEEYKQMILDSSAQEIVYTAAISGVNASFMEKSLQKNGISEADWAKPAKLDFGSEAKAWKNVWSAGQGVGSLYERKPAAQIISTFKAEFKSAIQKLTEYLK